jgi:folate-dependent phosphoribosylglycinamide formyltransferase PurN
VFLDYVALGILFFVVITLFYAIIAIHDVPYEIAKHRGHPHQDAIHVAGWVSLFTLHAIWPFLWIWALHPSGLACFSGTRNLASSSSSA